MAAAAVIAALAFLVVVAGLLLGGDLGRGPGESPVAPSPGSTAASPPNSPTTSPTTTPSAFPTASTPVAGPFRYQPLWPFTSGADAAGWQRRYRTQGTQPWHLDADQTALSFTTGFLGFTEIDRVVSSTIRGDDARVAVGYPTGGDRVGVAAVIHLVLLGSGPDAPWEVVGTRDTTLTVETPRYGATVSSPIAVGGRISGVDESIRVQVRQPSSEQPIGEYCCLPAGGERTPWSVQVAFRGATDPALTIVASTGGHLQGVERFAITGVRH
jgi:hypothetical protein